MNAGQAEAQFWAAFLRNRNVDAGTADDGAVPIAGGYAVYVKGTFYQLAFGLGTARPLRSDDLDIAREFYARRGARPVLEIEDELYLRDRAVLEAGGFESAPPALARYEAAMIPETGASNGVVARAVQDRAAWVRLVSRAFADGGAADEASRRSHEISAAAAHGLFVAEVGGFPAGAGAVAVFNGIAFLYAGAVLPEFRGRGVHGALLRARTAFGISRGAARTTIKTAEGSPAERAILRAGFARGALVRRLHET
ncbi:MAG TPA: GNAT family N-acetyltransferase [Candidatus Elarobacter sp.]|jgi:GNAT superfamily N-acetyltransferase|nr:GNAT family N-acetyltransferase [Candidatus Elarobacter sp.]